MSGTITVLQICRDNLHIAFHLISHADCTPLGCQLPNRETVPSTNRSVHGLSADCERWRHIQEAANIAIHSESQSSKITFPSLTHGHDNAGNPTQRLRRGLASGQLSTRLSLFRLDFGM